ncbi:N-acetylgalactosamine-4-sulfatase [Rhodopirellula islandica]|uniref:N-acetylgalactosamine-4-sulfatase n=1 Tax=Rhodopirellula islandica TaxID=595434 RepID=A0A0J1B409_RHOIS|nr:arylsulfatase [Rhodopirellula islandica]KLU01343.1 N-acetylgalactosamine-4-sulfatase [Rhodopirellula islandica]
MSRWLFCLVLLSVGSWSGGLLVEPVSAADRPNVVIVITDDQGYGDCGFTGNTVVQTPNIDALAAESSTLTDYHVAPTCSPTRSAFMTGHWTNRTGVWHTISGRSMLRDNEVTFGEIFRDAGYQTGMFGKWHLGDNYPYRAEDNGFTEVYRHGGGGVGQTPDFWDNAYFDGSYFHNGEAVKAQGFCTDVFFEQGNRFIRDCVEADEPFLAYIATNAPHGPLHAPQKYIDLYPEMSDNVATFLGMITNIDENVGRTRELLRELGVHDNTIFLFTTDNGTAGGASVYNAGMRGRKGSPYEGGHRVPFVMHYPEGGFATARSNDTLCHAVDVVPTLLELCDVDAPEQIKFDGTSIVSLLKDEPESSFTQRMLITDSQRVIDPIKWRQSSVMQNKWRLINGTELYNIADDAGQENDVAGDHPEQVASMRAFYDAWWAELEPTFSQTTEMTVGHPDHPVVTFTAHDWIGQAPPWNQSAIRAAAAVFPKKAKQRLTHQGHWAIQVHEAGTFEIALRRWPEESGIPIGAAVPPGQDVPGSSRAYRTQAGRAIPVKSAEVRVDGKSIASTSVASDDLVVTMEIELAEGSHQLAPVFKLPNGEVGAYYCTLSRKSK